MKKKILFILISILLINCSKNENPAANTTPIINEISTNQGKIGDYVIINGTNFSNILTENIVKFNGVQAVVISSTTSQITVEIPNNATSGFLTISVNNGPIVTIDNFIINTIITKWRLNKRFYNNQEQTLSVCEKQSFIEFFPDNTFDRKIFYESNGNCSEDVSLDSNKIYISDLKNNKIMLQFDDVDNGAQTENLNNIELTDNSFSYTWDENLDGVDEWKLEYIKY